MNSKAIKRQLLAAIAMVLVAALALGSSTYAWFVASGTVTATGMQVQAQSDGNLVISYKGTGWGTTATAGMQAPKELKPTSTADLIHWVWSKAKSPDAPTSNGDFTDVSGKLSHSAAEDDTVASAGCYDSPYALVKYFQIRSASMQNIPKGLYVKSITVDASQRMSTALRVGVECTIGDKTTRTIYAPVVVGEGDLNKASASYTVTQIIDGEKTTTPFSPKNYGDSTVAIVDKGTPIGTTEASIAKVYIYVWFEGEDHNLYSDNFYTEGLSVSVEFTSIETAQGQGNTGTGTTPSKIDLSRATVDTNSVQNISGTPYYKVSVQAEGKDLYTTDTVLTGSSKVYTIADGAATEYTNVTLPT